MKSRSFLVFLRIPTRQATLYARTINHGASPPTLRYERSPMNTTQPLMSKFRRPTAFALGVGLALSVLFATGADAATAPKKGAACPKSKVGETTADARNAPLICTKSGKKYVWKLTSAGDGGAVDASGKITQAWAGTYTYTADTYSQNGITSPAVVINGNVWLGLTQGDASAAYYNQVTISWDAKTQDGSCTSTGVKDGGGQLAMYSNFTRAHVTLGTFFELTCADGTKRNVSMQAFTTREPDTLPVVKGTFDGKVAYELRVYQTPEPKVAFSFSLKASTLADRPANPARVPAA
jgi:hypothetical protein